MLEIDRLKWAIFCGYNPCKRFYGDCCGYVSTFDISKCFYRANRRLLQICNYILGGRK